MTRSVSRFLIFAALILTATTTYAQVAVTREKTRDRLNALLQREGPNYKIQFSQSQKNPFSFVGVLKEGLTHAGEMHVLISVTESDTIGFKVFPLYNGAYINIDKVRNPPQLLRLMVQLNYKTFLFWGADSTGDIFTGYTFTLESGFPDEALKIVLASIKNSDQFVGQMKPSIDGTSAP